ncbi:MAG: LLM class flavin-dependent oxidoreductase [Candidatus Hodarchaeota archaeon]
MDYGISFIGGKFPMKETVEKANLSERLGFDYIWVGESPTFAIPFELIAAIAENTEKITIGLGIISPLLYNDIHTIKAFQTLKEVYGNRFIIGIGPGDRHHLESVGLEQKNFLKRIRECIKNLKEHKATRDMPVFVGAAGPKMIELASSEADGILLNYVHPSFIEWSLKRFKKKVYTVAYGPSLVCPDPENRKRLIMAAATVAISIREEIQETFGMKETIDEIKKIFEEGRFEDIWEYEVFLAEKFALCTAVDKLKEKIKEFGKIGVDQIIFSYPSSHDKTSIEKLSKTLF